MSKVYLPYIVFYFLVFCFSALATDWGTPEQNPYLYEVPLNDGSGRSQWYARWPGGTLKLKYGNYTFYPNVWTEPPSVGYSCAAFVCKWGTPYTSVSSDWSSDTYIWNQLVPSRKVLWTYPPDQSGIVADTEDFLDFAVFENDVLNPPPPDTDSDGFPDELETFLGTDPAVDSVSGQDFTGLKIENPYPFDVNYEILITYPNGDTSLQTGTIPERDLFGDTWGIELPDFGNLPAGASVKYRITGGGVEDLLSPSGAISDSVVGWSIDGESVVPDVVFPVSTPSPNVSGSTVSPGAGTVSDSWNSLVAPPADISTPSTQLLDAAAVASGIKIAKSDLASAVKSGVSGVEARQDTTNGLLGDIKGLLDGDSGEYGEAGEIVDIPIEGIDFDSEESAAGDLLTVTDGEGETPENIEDSKTVAEGFFQGLLTLVDIPSLGRDPNLSLPAFTLGGKSFSGLMITCDYPIVPAIRAASFGFFCLLIFWPFVVATRYAWG